MPDGKCNSNNTISTFEYKTGKNNTNADALSRISINNTNIVALDSQLSEDLIHEEQQKDEMIQQFRQILDGEEIAVKKNTKLWSFVNKVRRFLHR